jgi:phosphatidylserine/phosphatidylglycerophosphate/cardiolipin synthase-like enzyme
MQPSPSSRTRWPEDLTPPGSPVRWLVDNADTYHQILDAVRSARQSVWVMQLAFDADCVAHDVDRSPEHGSGRELLSHALIEAAARQDMDVRVLLNASLLLDTTRALRRYFASRGAARIEVRGVRHFPSLLHAKMIVIDERDAFLLGSPFANGYWDDSRHIPTDARRPLRELGGRPVHDVSCRVTGHAAQHLASTFVELWSRDEESAERTHVVGTGIAPRDEVRVLRTFPQGLLPRQPNGATEILGALIDGIDRARSLIYIEHQYLSARPVVRALARALRRRPRLEVVMVLNQNPDVTAYRGWQNARLRRYGLLAHPRVAVFTLWSAEPPIAATRETLELNQIFVHSKVVIVDDEWACVGTANLDGVSLHSYGDDFSGRLGRRVFRDVRNVDVNLVVENVRAGAHVSGSVAELRCRLWSEHLGVPAADLRAWPPDGWLGLWRGTARENLSFLRRGMLSAKVEGMMGHVLRYSLQPTPARQLADLGIRTDYARLDVRFAPSWLEVHLSPGWVRNMLS